jgi:hypothetical protein
MPIIMPDVQRPQEQKRESMWELLGRGFATGAGQSLGTGLGQLATQGLGSLMDPNQRSLDAHTLEMLGLTPEQAKAVASIKNPAVQRDIVDKMQARKEQLTEAQRKQAKANSLDQQLGAIKGQNYGQQTPQPGMQQGQPGMQQQPGQPVQSVTQAAPKMSDIDEILANRPIENDMEMVKTLNKARDDQRDFEQKERHNTEKGIRADHKDTEEGHNSRKANWEVANDIDIGRIKMEALDNYGDLDEPMMVKFLSSVGLSSLLKPDSALFNKIVAAFMTGASKAVGGKVSNDELKAHMARFPSLMISKEGRKLIYSDMKMMSALAREAYDIERDIVEKNNGYRPKNIDYLIDDRMADVYKKYEQQFIDNIRKADQISGRSGDKQKVNKNPILDAAPNPAEKKDKKFRTSTGIKISDGVEWLDEAEYNRRKSQASGTQPK